MADASVLVAMLLDNGDDGVWSARQLDAGSLAAPHIVTAEVVNVLRRCERSGEVVPEAAALAHSEFFDLSVALFPYEPFAQRVWSLRHAVTAYDGWYVALAESLDAPLVTLDRRLASAPGLRCDVVCRVPT